MTAFSDLSMTQGLFTKFSSVAFFFFSTSEFLTDLLWFLIPDPDCKLFIGMYYSTLCNSVLGTKFVLRFH